MFEPAGKAGNGLRFAAAKDVEMGGTRFEPRDLGERRGGVGGAEGGERAEQEERGREPGAAEKHIGNMKVKLQTSRTDKIIKNDSQGCAANPTSINREQESEARNPKPI